MISGALIPDRGGLLPTSTYPKVDWRKYMRIQNVIITCRSDLDCCSGAVAEVRALESFYARLVASAAVEAGGTSQLCMID